MEKFTSLKSKVMPLPIKDVDTDMIIPAQFLTSISREGYGENLFRRLRDRDAEFPTNLPKYKGAQILVADSNFGCGSSREHAVWAILGAGFKVVIAKSFADIFFNNSAKNGLILVTLADKAVDDLLAQAQAGDLEITVDLNAQEVTCASGTADQKTYHFDYDPFRRHCILNGLDDIDYILSMKDDIKSFRDKQDAVQKTCTTAANN
ncbi:MAG TPA: 3-isopropylmalate dehydratase small subunit [Chroococcales cyanobacterium]